MTQPKEQNTKESTIEYSDSPYTSVTTQPKEQWEERFDEEIGNFTVKVKHLLPNGKMIPAGQITQDTIKKFINELLLSKDTEWAEKVKRVEEELEIQKDCYKKLGEVAVFGRARVAGMVAEKYTRLGKIEMLEQVLENLKSLK